MGTVLKIITPDEIKVNLKKRIQNSWVVNVLSTTTERDIWPNAIDLIENGYPVYITQIKMKGKDWIRLRVGFFKDKKEADREGKKIMAILNLTDSWSTKIRENEFNEYGGY